MRMQERIKLACGCTLGWERCFDCRPGLHLDQETAVLISLGLIAPNGELDRSYGLGVLAGLAAANKHPEHADSVRRSAERMAADGRRPMTAPKPARNSNPS
jgi:hypothetical protein